MMLFLVCHHSVAQEDDKWKEKEEKTQKDTVKKDTAQFYKNLHRYSGKRKFTKFLHRLIFRPVVASGPNSQARDSLRNREKEFQFSVYEGKIIRKITIVTLNPFGYSLQDTATGPKKSMEKFGNRLHSRTKEWAIKNLLLFRKNQRVDSLIIRESERLIRSQRYIREVTIRPEFISQEHDSIDIRIRVLDSWNLVPTIAFSGSNIDLEVTQRSIFGTGHFINARYRKEIANGYNGYRGLYYVPNIANTYISMAMSYELDVDDTFRRGITVQRPFFSPFTRWAGGITIKQQRILEYLRNVSVIQTPEEFALQQYEFNQQDVWGGHAIQLFKGNTEVKRTTNFISSARVLRIRFLEPPPSLYDPLKIYTDQDLYLVSAGVSFRKFARDRYIFYYDIIEDVPIGKIYGITGGYQIRNNIKRHYIAGRYALGNYYNWGYYSINMEYGSFINQSRFEEGAANLRISYFTKLLVSGRWKFRQLVNTFVTLGINRHPFDNLSLNHDIGLTGFNSMSTLGNSRLLFTFQTQSYAPGEISGFQFGPFFSMVLGALSPDTFNFSKSRVYSQFAVGVIINNRYLVFNSFQLSFAFYPTIPDLGNNVIRMNGVRTTDFGFSDFEFGRPVIVPYESSYTPFYEEHDEYPR